MSLLGAAGALQPGRRPRWRNYFGATAPSIGRSIEGAEGVLCIFNVLYSKKGQQNIHRRWAPKKGKPKRSGGALLLLGYRWRPDRCANFGEGRKVRPLEVVSLTIF